jgi:hypothetical protein
MYLEKILLLPRRNIINWGRSGIQKPPAWRSLA